MACFAFGLGLVLALHEHPLPRRAYLVGIGLQVVVLRHARSSTRSTAPPPRSSTILEFNPLTAFVNAMRQSVYQPRTCPTAHQLGGHGRLTASSASSVGWMASSAAGRPSVIEEL